MTRTYEDAGWTESVMEQFRKLAKESYRNSTSVLCMVGWDGENKCLRICFSSAAGENERLDAMCDDIAGSFQLTARRLRQ